MSKRKPHTPAELDPYRRLIFLALAESDLRSAVDGCLLALDDAKRKGKPSDAYFAFSEISLMRYARPFAANRVVVTGDMKAFNAHLGDGYVPTHLDPNIALLHAQFMSIRDTMTAHTDMRNRNVVLSRSLSDVSQYHWHSGVHGIVIKPPSIESLRKIAMEIASRIHAEIDAVAQEVFGHLPFDREIQLAGGDPEVTAALHAARIQKQLRVRAGK